MNMIKRFDYEYLNKNSHEKNANELIKFYKINPPFKKLKLNLKLINSWMLQVIANITPSFEQAVKLQRKRGVKIGFNVYIGPNVHFDLLYPSQIIIEDFVSIGMNSSFYAHGNPTNSLYIKEKYYSRYIKPIRIGMGSWIAPHCSFLPGVKLGHHCVVGLGSIVTKNFPPFSVIAGNPAKLIKTLNSE